MSEYGIADREAPRKRLDDAAYASPPTRRGRSAHPKHIADEEALSEASRAVSRMGVVALAIAVARLSNALTLLTR